MDERDNSSLFHFEEDRAPTRGRETFLASVILHLLIVLLVATHPEIFETSPYQLAIRKELEQKEITPLYEPPRLPKLKAPPRSKVASKLLRPAPKSLPDPVAPPRQAQLSPAPLAAKPSESMKQDVGDKIAKAVPPIGIPNFPEPPKQRSSMEQVPKTEPPPTQARLKIPDLAAPSVGTDSILRGLAQEDASGKAIRTVPAPPMDNGPTEMSMNIPGPQILSDTMGVDFNPYLLRILTIVRRNWSTVIPEIARLGRPGRVVLQFTIQRSGNVPDVGMTGSSGTESLDSAALASIRLSNPFPPLPPEFPGQDIKLRFLYLYNMKTE